MFAQLEFNLCNGDETTLVVYRTRREAEESGGDVDKALLSISLSNGQLTELMVIQKIRPVNMNRIPKESLRDEQ